MTYLKPIICLGISVLVITAAILKCFENQQYTPRESLRAPICDILYGVGPHFVGKIEKCCKQGFQIGIKDYSSPFKQFLTHPNIFDRCWGAASSNPLDCRFATCAGKYLGFVDNNDRIIEEQFKIYFEDFKYIVNEAKPDIRYCAVVNYTSYTPRHDICEILKVVYCLNTITLKFCNIISSNDTCEVYRIAKRKCPFVRLKKSPFELYL